MPESADILVVDDEQVILAAARRILEREGLRVETAPDAESALEKMALGAAPIVVIDLKLPGMSGLEFLDRARVKYPDTLVILATGYATATHAIGSLMGGAFDYLPKPFAFQELLSPVRRAIRYLDLDASGHNCMPELHNGPYFCLGEISWARKESSGNYLLGPTSVFLRTIGKVAEVAVPSGNQIIHQGEPLAKVTSKDGYVHNVWVPLSGRVLDVNAEILEFPERMDPSMLEESWIVRISATDSASELTFLQAH